MADRATALAVIGKLKESGLDDNQIRERLAPLSEEDRNKQYDVLAQRFGIAATPVSATTTQAPAAGGRAGMNFTPDNAAVDRGRKLVQERGIGAAGTVLRGAAESQFLGKGEEVIGLAKGTVSSLTGKGPDTLQAIDQEKDIKAALQEDSPIQFAAGEIAGFLTGLPAAGTKLVGKAALSGIQKAIPIVQKVYPGITNPTVLNKMAKAFVVGGSELGLFEGAKETLESGDLKKAGKKALVGAAIGGVGAAAATGVIAPFTKSQAEKAIEKGMQAEFLEAAAKKEGDKAANLTRSMLNEDNPQVINAIIKDPKSVKRLVESGPVDDFSLGQRLSKEFDNLKTSLISSVGTMKKRIAKDTSQTIDTGFFKRAIGAVEKRLTTTDSKSVLTSADKQEFEMVKNLLGADKISASDATLVIDKIDSLVKYGSREASNISEQASKGLKLVRRALKTKLHVRYPEYAKADDNLFNFLREAEKIETPLTNNPEAFVKNIFGANKTQLRNSLVRIRGLAKKIDPTTAARTLELTQDISSARAAKIIREGVLPPPGRRTLQESSNKLIDKYTTMGTSAGAALGTYIGSVVGGFSGAAVGGTAGAAAGRFIGNKIGQAVGNPMRILNSALKSKQLSARAKMIAQEVKKVTISDGVDGFAKMMDLIPASAKGAQELGKFIINNSTLKAPDILDDEEIRGGNIKNNVNILVEKSLRDSAG